MHPCQRIVRRLQLQRAGVLQWHHLRRTGAVPVGRTPSARLAVRADYLAISVSLLPDTSPAPTARRVWCRRHTMQCFEAVLQDQGQVQLVPFLRQGQEW